ncbi:MAG TPA: hypothetical protein VNT32_04595 [Thermoleophilaceae bacterium]|nr:hypothetical protein [Thermoleophilaceae bacterium]
MSALARPACEGTTGRTSRSRRAARACGGSAQAGSAATLGSMLERAVRDLRARGIARCPVCAGEMTAATDAEGRCRGCGSALA